MRVPIVYLRILMILVNFGLAGVLAWSFGNELWGPDASDRSAIQIRDPREFGKVREVRQQTTDEGALMTAAANRLLPPPPKAAVPVPTPTTEEVTDPEPPPDDDNISTGPLEEEWEYVGGFIADKNPLETIVMLRKKSESPKTGASSSRLNRIRSSRTVRTSSAARRLARTRGRATPGQDDVIFFRVRDRRYTDEEQGLDFYIHSADQKRFVYWVKEGGRNSPFYKLARTSDSHYITRREQTRLPTNLEPEPSEDENPEGKDDEKEKHFEIVPANHENLVEKDYQQLVAGAMPSKELRGVKSRKRGPMTPAAATTGQQGIGQAPGVRARPVPSPTTETTPAAPDATAAEGAAAPETPATTEAGATPAPVEAPSGPVTDPEERARQLQELRETVRELPPDAQEQLQEALQGADTNG